MSGSVVVIEEKTGQRRRLELRGPALPKRGASYEAELGLVTTWFPGNPFEATQQVLSDQLLPSEWEGVWTTTRMIGTPSLYFDGAAATGQKITRADVMRDLMDDLCSSGALLRVTWATDDGRKVVREGRVGPRRFPHDRMDDIGWHLTFVWVSRGETAKRVVDFTSQDLEATTRALRAQLNDVQGQISSAQIRSANPRLPGSTTDVLLGDLERLAGAPLRFVNQFLQVTRGLSSRVTQIGELLGTVAATPTEIGAQLMGAAQEVQAAAKSFVDQASRVPSELLTTTPEQANSVVQGVRYLGRAVEGATAMQARAVALEEVARRRRIASSVSTSREDKAAPGDATTVVRAMRGDTFASLSAKHYGTPDRAAEIAKANGLPIYQVAPDVGQVLLIPVLASVGDVGRAKLQR